MGRVGNEERPGNCECSDGAKLVPPPPRAIALTSATSREGLFGPVITDDVERRRFLHDVWRTFTASLHGRSLSRAPHRPCARGPGQLRQEDSEAEQHPHYSRN
jgi:hypothetical protein